MNRTARYRQDVMNCQLVLKCWLVHSTQKQASCMNPDFFKAAEAAFLKQRRSKPWAQGKPPPVAPNGCVAPNMPPAQLDTANHSATPPVC